MSIDTDTRPQAPDTLRRRLLSPRVRSFLASDGFILFFLLWVVFLAFATDNFLTQANLLILLRQASIFAIVAIGTTMVLILGELDISFGSVLAFSGVLGAGAILEGWNPLLAILMTGLIGGAIGVVNGLLVTKVGIPSVVATLGAMGIFLGGALLYTGGTSIFGDELEVLFPIAQARLLGVPVLVIATFILYAIAWVITRRTRFGAHLYATGDHEQAAYRAGIKVERIKILVFTTAGFLAGIGGILQTARLGRGSATMGEDALFPVLTAVILGGASIEGGRGKVENTLIASVFLASLTNGLILLGVDSTVQGVVEGAVLILAVSLDRLRD